MHSHQNPATEAPATLDNADVYPGPLRGAHWNSLGATLAALAASDLCRRAARRDPQPTSTEHPKCL